MNSIQHSIRKRRLIVIYGLGLILLGSLNCKQKRPPTTAHQSQITILQSSGGQNILTGGGPNIWLVFLPLVYMDAEGQAQPGLLESWEHTDDYTEWTLHLRKNVKWGDGVPVTAKDVKFTIEFITNPEILWELKVFDKIAIIDDYTCRLSNNRPFSALLYRAGGIYPQHILGDLQLADIYYSEFWTQPVGNGPYRYVRHVPQTMVELEYNPDYFGEKPNIENIIFKFGDNRITELLSGNVDAALNVPPLEVIKLGRDPRFNIYHEFNVTNAYAIIWNHKSPLFKSSAVRRALTLALNRKELIQVLNLPESTPIFDTIITQAQFYRGEVPVPLSYDPDQARRILETEGWVSADNDEGVLVKDGREFRFTLIVSEDQLTAAVYIQDQLRNVGVHMELAPMDLRFLVAKHDEGEYDALLRGFQQFDSNWGFGGYDNPVLKQLLDNAIHSTSFDEVDRYAAEVAPIFQKDLPWLMLYPDVRFHIVHKRIRGLENPFRAHPIRFIQQLWIEEEEQEEK